MGQLEKYGLYVLCLVIFLILGVAIWGGPEVGPAGRTPAGGPAALRGERTGGTANASFAPSASDLLGGGASQVGGSPNASGPNGVGPNGGSPVNPPSPNVDGPQPQPQPQPAARPQHKVASGDTYESIARKLGSVRLVGEIRRLNPKVDPSRMQLNVMLDLPTPAEVQAILGGTGTTTNSGTTNSGSTPTVDKPQPTPAIAGTRTYKIVKGDTLEGIARRELGNPRRVSDITALNPGTDPGNLKIGRSLVLPAK
jgi:LysM repeat protein